MSINEDENPQLKLEVTYPVESTHEDRMAGRGMVASVQGSDMSAQEIINALLMTAEQLLTMQVREIHEKNQTPLMPTLDKVVTDSLVTLNARVLMMSEVSELAFAPGAEQFKLTIPDYL